MNTSSPNPLATFLVSTAITLSGVAWIPDSAADETRVGVAGAVNPATATIQPNGNQRTLFIGNDVVFRERIRTDAGGRAQLIFLDRSALSVGPNAELTIDEFVFDPATSSGKLAVNATVGVFRFVGGKLSKSGNVEIRTPSAVLGIRGGIAIVEVGRDGSTTATLVYGKQLTVTSRNGVQQVVQKPGFSVTVAPTSTQVAAPARAAAATFNRQIENLEAAPRQDTGAAQQPAGTGGQQAGGQQTGGQQTGGQQTGGQQTGGQQAGGQQAGGTQPAGGTTGQPVAGGLAGPGVTAGPTSAAVFSASQINAGAIETRLATPLGTTGGTTGTAPPQAGGTQSAGGTTGQPVAGGLAGPGVTAGPTSAAVFSASQINAGAIETRLATPLGTTGGTTGTAPPQAGGTQPAGGTTGGTTGTAPPPLPASRTVTVVPAASVAPAPVVTPRLPPPPPPPPPPPTTTRPASPPPPTTTTGPTSPPPPPPTTTTGPAPPPPRA